MNEQNKLSDFSGQFLFLNADTMRDKLKDDISYRNWLTKRESAKGNCLTFLIPIITLPISIFSDGSIFPLSIVDASLAIIWVTVLLALIWNLKGLFDANREIRKSCRNIERYGEDLFAQVQEAAKAAAEYTAVIVIAKEDQSKLKYFCRGKDRFLYHVKVEDKEKKTLLLGGLEQKIKSTIRHDFPALVDNEILQIELLKDTPIQSVKALDNSLRSVVLFLYTAHFSESAKSKIEADSNYTWLTLEELEEDVVAMQTNYDVIGELKKHKNRISNSFSSNFSDLHVIWNITQGCSYNCAICATRDENREELDLSGKLRLLNNLAHEKDRIRIIDFAGGDPCNSGNNVGLTKDNLTVIQTAISIFGKEKVSLTTTAAGIMAIRKKRNDGELRFFDMPSKCEITFDASHQSLSQENKESNYRESRYNEGNASVQVFPVGIRYLTVNVPILDDDLSDAEIEKIVKKITTLQKDHKATITVEVNLIRMMPVGGYGYKLQNDSKELKKYEQYRPMGTAKKIKSALTERGIPCSYHCSLRVFDSETPVHSRCSMLQNKLGIDCAGNVFTCAWGGYLPQKDGGTPETNQFYLGNLANSTFTEIMSLEQFKTISSHENPTDYCKAVSLFFGDRLFENNDPLARSECAERGRA